MGSRRLVTLKERPLHRSNNKNNNNNTTTSKMNGIRKNKADPNMPKRKSLADQMREIKQARVAVSSSSSESDQSLKLKDLDNCSKAESQESKTGGDFNTKQNARKSKIDNEFKKKEELYEHRKKETELMKRAAAFKGWRIAFYVAVAAFIVLCPIIFYDGYLERLEEVPEECDWHCGERCESQLMSNAESMALLNVTQPTQSECVEHCEVEKKRIIWINRVKITSSYDPSKVTEEDIKKICNISIFDIFSFIANLFLFFILCMFKQSLNKEEKEIRQEAKQKTSAYGETLDEVV